MTTLSDCLSVGLPVFFFVSFGLICLCALPKCETIFHISLPGNGCGPSVQVTCFQRTSGLHSNEPQGKVAKKHLSLTVSICFPREEFLSI